MSQGTEALLYINQHINIFCFLFDIILYFMPAILVLFCESASCTEAGDKAIIEALEGYLGI